MRGKLFGIGVGPGDPELLTLKAIRSIRECNVIAMPNTGRNEKTAYSIIEKYSDGKELLECHFPMEKDEESRRKARRAVAFDIIQFLNKGKDVGFVTLGDPTTYSTYMYVHEIIVGEGFEAEIIPGITSYSAAAAALGISLCEGNEVLTLIPGYIEKIDDLLDFPGNKVVMKSGGNLLAVLKKLKEHGYGNRTKIVCRATMKEERLYNSIADYKQSPDMGYFTIVVAKEKI